MQATQAAASQRLGDGPSFSEETMGFPHRCKGFPHGNQGHLGYYPLGICEMDFNSDWGYLGLTFNREVSQ